MGELNSNVYEVSSENEDEIINRHYNYLSSLKLAGPKKLGYLYSSTKFHKNGARKIASMASCTTTTASILVSKLSHTVLSTLRRKDDENILRTGVRKFFVVQGYEEVADFLKNWKFLMA